MHAIERLPKGAWTGGIAQNGDLVADTFVAEVTGLLDLGSWKKIPDLRIMVRDEPLHPPLPQAGHRTGETTRAPLPTHRHQHPCRAGRLARRAAPLPCPPRERRQTGQGPRPEPVALAAVGDQRRVDPGRRPGREPARLLPTSGPARGRAARRSPETAALPTAAPTRPPDPRATQTVAAPTRGLALDRRPGQRLARGQGTDRDDLTTTTKPRRSRKDHCPERGTRRPRRDSRTPTLPREQEAMIKIARL